MPLQATLSFMSTMSQLKFFAQSQMALTFSQPPTAWWRMTPFSENSAKSLMACSGSSVLIMLWPIVESMFSTMLTPQQFCIQVGKSV